MAKYLIVIGKTDQGVRRGGFVKLADLKVNLSTEEVKEITEWPIDVSLKYAKWDGSKVVELTADEKKIKDSATTLVNESNEWKRMEKLLTDNKVEAKIALGI